MRLDKHYFAALVRDSAKAIPRGDHHSQLTFELDKRLPVLLFRLGNYPLHHGTVGAIRSLGRAGVPVYAVTEDPYTPAAMSRYLTGRFPLEATGCEDPSYLLDQLRAIGGRMEAKPAIICTDDVGAVLVAEGASSLRHHFILPNVRTDLPRQLASKRFLHRLCQDHAIPTPRSTFPASRSALDVEVEHTSFPVVVKNTDPWLRLCNPTVQSSTLIESPSQLRELSKTWREPFGITIQEYLPIATSEDWIVHGYSSSGARGSIVFTGRKLRSWPPHLGATAYARVLDNDYLAELATSFCRKVGYSGIFDLDWRFDTRTGQYYLLDFNPRLGAQFRLFEDSAGVDVVRAMHLDLSDRPLPAGHQLEGDRIIIEFLDLRARRAYRGSDAANLQGAERIRPRVAWLAADDLLPVASMVIRQFGMVIRKLARVTWRHISTVSWVNPPSAPHQ